MLIVVGGTHAGSKLKSTEVSIFSHSLGRLWCAITFDCDYHQMSSSLPQLIKGTELL